MILLEVFLRLQKEFFFRRALGFTHLQPNGYRGPFPGSKAARALSPVVKLQVREAKKSASTSAEVKNTWIYTSNPPYTFMV
jgi:hypothetical protein